MTARSLRVVEEVAHPASSAVHLRLAVASHDGKGLNAHFGSAKKFYIYDVSASDCQLREIADFDDASQESGAHDASSEDRITPRIAALAGCDLLFVLAIGAPVAARVVKADIRPIKIASAEPMADVIAKVQAMLTGTPAPWLRKVLSKKGSRSMSFLEEEDAP